ncbi:putative transcription factor [Iris pallida]|uniref:Transcription factor n=1 Tax=Iris pallida TaxID=29817 RepID=A0AAX6EXT9_IRIPA|nr:putative transcription factor [Iris pallida]
MATPAEDDHVGNHVGFEDEEDDLEDTEDSDMEEYEDDFAATPVPVVSINPNPNPPLGQHNGSIVVQPLSSSADRKENKPPVTPTPAPPAPPASASGSLEDSRRLFQRLWTDDDEIKILNGFLEFTSSRGTTFASHQYDTGPFYEQIKNQLQLDFNKNQLIEKLRRLKKKYRNTAARMASHGKEFSFKSPHERATYEIARRIWSVGSSVKRSRESDDDDLNPYANNNNSCDAAAATSERRTARSRRRGRKRALETIPVAPAPLMLTAPPILAPPVLAGPSEGVVKVEVQTTPAQIIPPIPFSSTALLPPLPPPPPPPIPSIVEETVKGCLSPILKELLNSAVRGSIGSGLNGLNGGLGFGIMGLAPPPVFGFGGNSVNSSAAAAGDERWKKQQILELEVYLKRVELVRDEIKSTLKELKSSEPKAAAAVLTPAAPTRTTGS